MLFFTLVTALSQSGSLLPAGGESVIRVPKLLLAPAPFLKAQNGYSIELFADGLNQPRKLTIAPNGDVFVVETRLERPIRNQPHRVVVLSGYTTEHGPTSQSVWSDKLNYPFGIQFAFDHLYVANTGSIVRWQYKLGQRVAHENPEVILSNIPEKGYRNHWTRNILFDRNHENMFLSIGSVENLDEETSRRAVIEQYSINPEGRVSGFIGAFAKGMRNPIGLAFEPNSKVLWANVAERDYEGDNLVPDYLTSVKKGGFYGWPYAYIGNHHDKRMPRKPALEKTTIVPDVLFEAHSTPIDVVFVWGGAVVTLHGSQNRSRLNGYKVVFIPFGKNGKPVGKPQDLVTGWLPKGSNREIYGRPAGLSVLPDESLLIVDDWGGKIWRLKRAK